MRARGHVDGTMIGTTSSAMARSSAKMLSGIFASGQRTGVRVREPLWHWLHERLLWRYALAALEGSAPFESVTAPANESALLDVLHALGRRVEITGEPDPDPAAGGARATMSPMSVDDPLRTALRGAHELHEVIVSPRCLDFEVQRTAIDQFARTQRGKVPVLYQHGICG